MEPCDQASQHQDRLTGSTRQGPPLTSQSLRQIAQVTDQAASSALYVLGQQPLCLGFIFDAQCLHHFQVLAQRFLAAHVRGRGTTVLTACSHAGVVNVGLEARRLLPDQPVDLLLGGYHLAGTTVEDRIEPTVRDLQDLVSPGLVAPGHCTGWRAAAALASAFSPTAFAPSVVGTRYLLGASAA